MRFIYRKMDEAFANELTTIPSTLDDEVCIYFNGDVAKGGFVSHWSALMLRAD